MTVLGTYLVLFVVAISINCAAGRRQHTDDHKKDDVVHGVRIEPHHHVSMRVAYQPIRISLYYTNIPDNVLNKIKKLMSEVTTYFSQTLRVKPVGVPLLLERECNNLQYAYKNGIKYCTYGCNPSSFCGEPFIPDDHYQACRQCSGGMCTTTGTSGGGVPNADYILYVTAIDSGPCRAGGAGAHARTCQSESSLDRPIAGNVNFCLRELNTNSYDYMLKVAKHETIHALGFNKQSIAFWRDQNGDPRTPRDSITNLPPRVNGDYISSTSTVTTYTHTNWAVQSGVISHIVTLLITPAVVEKARAYFNCPTLIGVELENQGGSGAVMSHWDKRLLGNELMTGGDANGAKLSILTLALLQDTGWYQVDYSKAEQLNWGRNAGCEFVFNSCGGYIDSRLASGRSIEPFCNTVTDESKALRLGCTVDRDAVGYCNLVKLNPSPPADYQYFAQLGSNYGGDVEKADYCPFQKVFTYQKDGRGTSCADVNNSPSDVNYLGETYGPGSMCLYQGTKKWVVTSATSPRKTYTPEFDNNGAGCYQVTSLKGSTTITVLKRTYQCSRSGQQIDVDVILNGMRYQGSVLCP